MQNKSHRLSIIFILLGMTTFLLNRSTQPTETAWGMPATNNQHNPQAGGNRLGTNLAELQFWSTGYAFLDAFKMSHTWYTQTVDEWDTEEYDELSLDSDGWVTTLPDAGDPDVTYRTVGTVMLRGLGGHFPAGQYVVLYEGEGTIEYQYNGNLRSLDTLKPKDEERALPSDKYTLSDDGKQLQFAFDGIKNEALSAPGRDVLDVTPDNNGIYLQITATDPNETGDYIRNIRVIMPGYETLYEQEIFHPDYLTILQPYHAIRFMDWMRTNGSEQAAWADRPTLTYYTYASEKGVPVEMMVEFANRLGADPWFTLPHQANNTYVRNFANVVKANLDSDLRVYLEYSNEVWNFGFPQGGWVEAKGVAEWQTSTASDYAKRINWYGKRSSEICDLWHSRWGGQAGRITCVMGAQAANEWTATQALACPLWSGEPCLEHGIDGVAIAPYFGGYIGSPEHENNVAGWTTEPDGGLDMLFEEIEVGDILTGTAPADGALTQAITRIQDYQWLATTKGLQLLSYEGGQHLTGYNGVEQNDEIAGLFMEANRDDRMGELYDSYLDAWEESGGGLFMHYHDMGNYNRWGSWGAWEHMDQFTSVKYSALLRYLDRTFLYMPAIFRQ